MIQELIHSQRPAVIIEAHGHAQVVRALNAQILHFVARLRDCTAEASQNHRRNPQYPEISQLSKRTHMSSFPPVKLWCRDDWNLSQVPLGARTVSVQLRAELAHNFTNSC